MALTVFFALAYGLSWSWLLPLAAAHQQVRRAVGWPTHYPALLGPAAAALVVTVWTNVVSGTQAATGTIAAIVSTLVMVQGIALVVLELRARHRGLPSVQGPR